MPQQYLNGNRSKSRKTKRLGLLIRIVVTVLIISFIFQNVDIDKVLIQLAQTE